MAADPPFPDALRIIDSHTEGEPTRTIVEGFPPLQGATIAEQREDFARRFDGLRKALICEPRGYDAIVGALLVDAQGGSPAPGTLPHGVIFFNDAGVLGMCGHGTIGVAHTLRYLGIVDTGTIRLETAVGPVEARCIEGSRAIEIDNVRSFVDRRVTFDVGGQSIAGDVAYGGNWFFLHEVPLSMLVASNLDGLMVYCKAIRAAMQTLQVTASDGSAIDHIELYAPHGDGYRNFVLCPGNAYDRSPCGTGTSAKLACLAHVGALEPGQTVRMTSVTGGVFEGRYRRTPGGVLPTISGRAWVTGELRPIFEGD